MNAKLGVDMAWQFYKQICYCMITKFYRIYPLFSVAVVEVERLWDRFQQLGADKDGLLMAEKLQQHPVYSNNVFVKNVSTLPVKLKTKSRNC